MDTNTARCTHFAPRTTPGERSRFGTVGNALWRARADCRDWGSDWEDSSGGGEERNRCVIGGCKLRMGSSQFSFVFIRLSRSYHAISKDF